MQMSSIFIQAKLRDKLLNAYVKVKHNMYKAVVFTRKSLLFTFMKTTIVPANLKSLSIAYRMNNSTIQ